MPCCGSPCCLAHRSTDSRNQAEGETSASGTTSSSVDTAVGEITTTWSRVGAVEKVASAAVLAPQRGRAEGHMTSIGFALKKAISRLSAATGVAPSAAGTARRATSAWMWASAPLCEDQRSDSTTRWASSGSAASTYSRQPGSLRLIRCVSADSARYRSRRLVDPKHSLDDDHGRSLAAWTGDSLSECAPGFDPWKAHIGVCRAVMSCARSAPFPQVNRADRCRVVPTCARRSCRTLAPRWHHRAG